MRDKGQIVELLSLGTLVLGAVLMIVVQKKPITSLTFGSFPCAITTNGPSPQGTMGAPYSQTLTESGCAASTWTITAGSLPSGLTLNGITGKIAGQPPTVETVLIVFQGR